MAVVGVLVEAVVGHEHDRVAHLVAEVAQRGLDHAVGRVGAGAVGVLRRGHAEEDHRGHAEVGERPHLLAQALLRVLHHPGHRHHRLGVGDALLHEQRRHEVVDGQPCLGDEATHRGRVAEPPHPALGERHRGKLRTGP